MSSIIASSIILYCWWSQDKLDRQVHLYRRRLIAVTVLLCLVPLHQANLGMSQSNSAARLRPRMHRLWFPAQKRVVEWMGDTKLRRIGRNLIAPEQLEEMRPHLAPGDILLMRKNWYLSNIGLPGFWPHAELYIGGPEKLEAFSIQPEVLAFMTDWTGRKISLTEYLQHEFPDSWETYVAGHDGVSCCIIQALSEGVVLSTLKQGTGDYLAALRPRISAAARARAIIEAFGYLDKPYDFDFDFASDDALVCTELVWRCYRPTRDKKGLRFALVEIAGRQTLPANEIAGLYVTERHQPDRQLDFVYFLDASEKQQKGFVADEASFVESYERTKWDLAQK